MFKTSSSANWDRGASYCCSDHEWDRTTDLLHVKQTLSLTELHGLVRDLFTCLSEAPGVVLGDATTPFYKALELGSLVRTPILPNLVATETRIRLSYLPSTVA